MHCLESIPSGMTVEERMVSNRALHYCTNADSTHAIAMPVVTPTYLHSLRNERDFNRFKNRILICFLKHGGKECNT